MTTAEGADFRHGSEFLGSGPRKTACRPCNVRIMLDLVNDGGTAAMRAMT
jgi:hypothetical protein